VANSEPTGQESISNLQSLSRTYFNDAGQASRTDDYFLLSGLSYSSSANFGTLNTNYYETKFGYDSRGRQNRVQNPDGTINRTVYDGLGRVVSEWTGTNDSNWSDTTGAIHMTEVKQYKYDENNTTTTADDIGDSNVTSVIESPNSTVPGERRVTTLDYDFRDRLISTTLPDPDNNPITNNTPVYTTAYDNLDRVTSTTDPQGTTAYAYDPFNRTVTTTQPDPGGNSQTPGPITKQYFDARGLLTRITDPDGNNTRWTYDGAGRVTNESNQLGIGDRSYKYDAAGRLTQRTDRLGRQIVYAYDAVGNNTSEKWFAPNTNVVTGTPVTTITYQPVEL
jgi:YD repeat-containing protein